MIKKQELDDTNDCRCRDGNEDFLSSQAQCTLEEDNNIEGLSFTEKKLQNKNHTGCNKKKEETLSIESISIDFKKEQFSNSEQTKKILESPNSVTPVAPPRRKKKGAKKDTKQVRTYFVSHSVCTAFRFRLTITFKCLIHLRQSLYEMNNI